MQKVSTFSLPIVGQFIELDNDLYVLFKDQFINLEKTDNIISLKKHGITNHVGQAGVGSDGTIYLNGAGQSTSLSHKWNRFKRAKEPKSNSKTGSLLACDRYSSCYQWGESKLHFDTAWAIFDVGQDQFLVNDIARHQIHLTDANGQILDTLDGFLFPNHILYYKGSYWVVNTNTNSFIELSITAGSLKRTGATVIINNYIGIPSEYRFPSMAYAIDGGSIIVLTHPNGMNAGRVYRLENGTAIQLFSNLKDITSVYFYDEELYVSDYESNSLWTMELSSGITRPLRNIDYDSAIEQAKSEASLNWFNFIYLSALIIGLGILALVFALYNSKPTDYFKIKLFKEGFEPIKNINSIVWVEENKQRLDQLKKMETLFKISTYLIVISLFLLFLFIIAYKGLTLKVIMMLGQISFLSFLMIGFILLMLKFSKSINREKLGWDGVFIHIINKQGHSKNLPEDVFYDQNRLYANETTVLVQKLRSQFFDKQSFENIISPVLLLENKKNAFSLFLLRLKEGGKEIRNEILFLLLGLGCYAILIFSQN